MTWFKVDDGLPTSRKVLSIPRGKRLAAIGLWTLAGTWSAGEETDGFIPNYILKEWSVPPAPIAALVLAKLWLRVPDGHQFAKWEEWQPTREKLDAERVAGAERQARSRAARRAMSRRDTPVSHTGVTPLLTRESRVSHGGVTAVSQRPDPTRPVSNSSSVASSPFVIPNKRSSSSLPTKARALGE